MPERWDLLWENAEEHAPTPAISGSRSATGSLEQTLAIFEDHYLDILNEGQEQ
jgi:hypothetical protein